MPPSRWPAFSHLGKEYVIVPAFDASSGERARALDPAEASGLVDSVLATGVREGLDRSALVALALEISLVDSGARWRTADEELHVAIREALRLGRLLVVTDRLERTQGTWTGGKAAAGEEPAATSSAPVASAKKLSWIGVKVVDEADRPVGGVAVRLSGPGVLRDATTTEDGLVMASEIEDGSYSVELPGHDAAAWSQKGGAAPAAPESANGRVILARSGDCIESLAYAHGLFWQTIWEHSKNADLKKERKSPNVLRSGDQVFVPAIRPRPVQVPSGREHTLVLRGVPSRLRLQFRSDGEPQAGVPYLLRVDEQEVSGTLDGDGGLDEVISPAATEAIVYVGSGDERECHIVKLGALDPLAAMSGWCGRLVNLGYLPAASVGDEAAARAALHAFQRDHEIDGTGELDDSTSSKLAEIHQS